MSDNVIHFPRPSEPEQRTVALKDIDCLAILTTGDEMFYIDNPRHIEQVVAFIQQQKMKFKVEVYNDDGG